MDIAGNNVLGRMELCFLRNGGSVDTKKVRERPQVFLGEQPRQRD